MNYVSVFMVAVALFAIICWYVAGRFYYVGPRVNAQIIVGEAPGAAPKISPSASSEGKAPGDRPHRRRRDEPDAGPGREDRILRDARTGQEGGEEKRGGPQGLGSDGHRDLPWEVGALSLGRKPADARRHYVSARPSTSAIV